MKTLIVALNSKYIHSSLGIWYLKESCKDGCGEVKIFEYTINDNKDQVLSNLYKEQAHVVAFSCYIWNIEMIIKTASDLKKISPHTKIVLGGPEVSFEVEEILKDNPWVDFVISGEGEETIGCLLRELNKNLHYWYNSDTNDTLIKAIEEIKGLSYRKGEGYVINDQYVLIEDLDRLPSPYSSDMIEKTKGRIVYYESSRGCPFSCSYCMSSTFSGIRYFNMNRVKEELRFLINSNVRLVKFVDRTFNCNRERAKELFLFIIENAKQTTFHFEVAGDLFDGETLNILSRAPQGLIQLEIGVQTTNEKTLEVIRRKTNILRINESVNFLINARNIHLHLDLIAGLPYEDYQSFRRSFDHVYGFSPHQLQLGFLKLLKGSYLKKTLNKHGYQYRKYPPYEVLESDVLSFFEITKLKGIEEVLEKYYNSGRFTRTLKYIIEEHFKSPFDFYSELAEFFEKMGYEGKAFSSRELYNLLKEFLISIPSDLDLVLVNELMKFDLLVSDNTNNLPKSIERINIDNLKEMCFQFLKDVSNIERFLPQYINLPPKHIYNKVHFEVFSHHLVCKEKSNSGNEIYEDLKLKKLQNKFVILFNYGKKDAVSGHYEYFCIRL